MRLATVDLGTNTMLLLVADVAADGSLAPIYEEERFVRLGKGVDRNGMVSTAAIERVKRALSDYAATVAHLGANMVTIAGTSASRDAANRDELSRMIEAEVGVAFDVLSGEEEALWAFRGALSAVPHVLEACVLDVGGGSTELIAGDRDGHGLRTASLDVGGVRLTERIIGTVPPPAHAVRAARSLVETELASVRFGRDMPLVGTAGTVTSLAHLVSGGARRPLRLAEVQAWLQRLLGLSADGVRAIAPEVLTGREDVFAAGVLIVEAAMRHLGAGELLPSPHGLRHGLALRWLEARSTS